MLQFEFEQLATNQFYVCMCFAMPCSLVLKYQLHNRVGTLLTFQPDALTFFKVNLHPDAQPCCEATIGEPSIPFSCFNQLRRPHFNTSLSSISTLLSLTMDPPWAQDIRTHTVHTYSIYSTVHIRTLYIHVLPSYCTPCACV